MLKEQLRQILHSNPEYVAITLSVDLVLDIAGSGYCFR